MAFENAFIPYGSFYSTPFARWQGKLAPYHSVQLAAGTCGAFLQRKGIEPGVFDGVLLGLTVPQRSTFYGAPWLAGMLGADGVTGPTVAQACATSTRMLASAALEVETGQRACLLAVAADRTSNGPHVYYPDPGAPGGTGIAENPVLDSFARDPNTRQAMIATAENVAAAEGIPREEQDAITVLRYEQYAEALADDRAFQKRFFQPVELKRGRKVIGTLEEDEGVFPTDSAGLAKLRPVTEGGSVTFGTQTHPADGNAAMVVCDRAHAERLGGGGPTVRLLSYGEARVEKAFMPRAVAPAARDALQRAGMTLADCKAIKTHNPFAVNDVLFCREMDLPADRVNRFGSPLVYGHPQAPMGLRVVIELIEELAVAGGGVGLFSGCAAGDTAMALVLRVG